jgi:hypothetical protein
VWRSGALSIEDLRFDFSADRLYRAADGQDLTDEIEWATFGQRVLRNGAVARIDDLLDQFYDVRHARAFDHRREEGERTRRALYDGSPATFSRNTKQAWHELGVPRARYFHNAVGLAPDAVTVVQREGTVEEVGGALQRGRGRRRDHPRQWGQRGVLGVVGEPVCRRRGVAHG